MTEELVQKARNHYAEMSETNDSDYYLKIKEELNKIKDVPLTSKIEPSFCVELLTIKSSEKKLDYKETMTKLQDLDNVAKHFGIKYKLEYNDKTVYAKFNYLNNYASSCYQEAINFIQKINKMLLKLHKLYFWNNKIEILDICCFCLALLIGIVCGESAGKLPFTLFMVSVLATFINMPIDKYINHKENLINNETSRKEKI